ncbi:MAG: ribosome biogenesis GTP-binding protein YihA/YsxC [Oscillospiraceae bacterium]|jgi:GTP-binding protein|nr:ribosome biogenesis GTP-binding protein YihA/YsxC [Oscillospiraceae bacterium]
MNIQNTVFVKSAASRDAFIRDGKPVIAFAGRSNVGKSSVINCLVRRKNFARVSATPGKTAHVNYFLIDGGVYLADLPGYGYAKVSGTEKARWAELMEAFFASGSITAGVQIVDARHEPTGDDITMAQWFHDTGTPLTIVANKTDKLKAREIEPNLLRIADVLSANDNDTIIPFSAEKSFNRDVLVRKICEFFQTA